MADPARPRRRTISRRIYLYRAADDFILVYPFYSLMFLDHGLDNTDIGVLVAVFCVAGIAMEIPSGALADRFDRRHVLAFGALLKTIGFAAWVAFPNFGGYLAGFLLWGAQYSMQSGTFEALVYDELKAAGREDAYVRVVGRAEAVALVAVVAAAATAAPAVALGYGFLLVMSIAVSVISGVAALSLPSAPHARDVEDRRYFDVLKTGWSEAVTSRTLLFPIAVVAFAGGSGDALEDWVAPFARDVGLGDSTVAIAYGAMAAGAALGGVLAHRFADVSAYRPPLLMFGAGAVLLLAAVLAAPPSVLLLITFYFLIQAASTGAEGRLQHSIRGTARATVTSVAGFGNQILNVAVLILFGWAADTWSRFAAFGGAGAAVLVVAAVLMVLAHRQERARTLA